MDRLTRSEGPTPTMDKATDTTAVTRSGTEVMATATVASATAAAESIKPVVNYRKKLGKPIEVIAVDESRLDLYA
jgi:hypothetical protein